MKNEKGTRVTPEQLKLNERIAARAASYIGCEAIDIEMDLTYCIEGGCNLRLNAMLEAKEWDILHDVCGINRHLNHETHKLEGGFWPRFAGKEDR